MWDMETAISLHTSLVYVGVTGTFGIAGSSNASSRKFSCGTRRREPGEPDEMVRENLPSRSVHDFRSMSLRSAKPRLTCNRSFSFWTDKRRAKLMALVWSIICFLESMMSR
jgi:hypothetical protein